MLGWGEDGLGAEPFGDFVFAVDGFGGGGGGVAEGGEGWGVEG